jgi:hypothetical protein
VTSGVGYTRAKTRITSHYSWLSLRLLYVPTKARRRYDMNCAVGIRKNPSSQHECVRSASHKGTRGIMIREKNRYSTARWESPHDTFTVRQVRLLQSISTSRPIFLPNPNMGATCRASGLVSPKFRGDPYLGKFSQLVFSHRAKWKACPQLMPGISPRFNSA